MRTHRTNRARRLIAGAALISATFILPTALSATPAAALGPLAEVCRDPYSGGVCQTVTSDIADLNGSTVGDNTITSVAIARGTYLVLYTHPNYQGTCQEFDAPEGMLRASVIGDDVASSLKVRTAPGTCGNMTMRTPLRGINHFQTITETYYCPWTHPYEQLLTWNASSPNVSTITAFTPTGMSVTYTNWNLTGDQVAGAMLWCGTVSA